MKRIMKKALTPILIFIVLYGILIIDANIVEETNHITTLFVSYTSGIIGGLICALIVYYRHIDKDEN